jgi:hypothetical protein
MNRAALVLEDVYPELVLLGLSGRSSVRDSALTFAFTFPGADRTARFSKTNASSF